MNPFVDDGMHPFMEDIALTDDDNDADEDYDDLPGQQLRKFVNFSVCNSLVFVFFFHSIYPTFYRVSQ